jgi:hypothetical protein
MEFQCIAHVRAPGATPGEVPDPSAGSRAPPSRDRASLSITDIGLPICERRRLRGTLHRDGARSDCEAVRFADLKRPLIAPMTVVRGSLAPACRADLCCARRAARHLSSIFEFEAFAAERCR